MPPPQHIIFTSQSDLRKDLITRGICVTDDRDGSQITVAPEQLIVVKNVEEYKKTYRDKLGDPAVVFGTMQMGERTERWEIMGEGTKVAMTAANGSSPYMPMVDTIERLGLSVIAGHNSPFVKVGATSDTNKTMITARDHGKYVLGPLSDDPTRVFESVRIVLGAGFLFDAEYTKETAQVALKKTAINVANIVPFLITCANYVVHGGVKPVPAQTYGVHLSDPRYLSLMIKFTRQFSEVKGESNKKITDQIIANIMYVSGQDGEDLKKDDLKRIINNELESLAAGGEERIAKYVFDKIGVSHGSGHPPTDAQHASKAKCIKEGVQPTKPVENKLKAILDSANDDKKRGAKELIFASEFFDAYNEAVISGELFRPSFKVLGLSVVEMLSGATNTAVIQMKLPSEEKNSGLSNAARNMGRLGENAIQNGERVTRLIAEGKAVLRGDIGGVRIPIDSRVMCAGAKAAKEEKWYRYNTETGVDIRKAVARFCTRTGGRTVFGQDQVMMAPTRAKLVPAWVLNLVPPEAPVFVQWPGYNPHASAAIFANRQLYCINTSTKRGLMPLIEAVADYKRTHERPVMLLIASPANPLSTVTTKAEAQKIAELLKQYPDISFYLDQAYAGYEKGVTDVHDPLAYSGDYNSPQVNAMRVRIISGSKILNKAGSSALIAGSEPMINFLEAYVRGTATSANTMEKGSIKERLDTVNLALPKSWWQNMGKFKIIVDKQIPDVELLQADCPPFYTFNIEDYLNNRGKSGSELQSYLLDNGLGSLVGGFGPETDHFLRVSFTAMTAKQVEKYAHKLVCLMNEEW